MIESIFGKIVSITNNDLVINVGPINLSVLIPSSDKYLNLKSGDDIKINTFLDVKEDSLTLIGFLESNERKLFQTSSNDHEVRQGGCYPAWPQLCGVGTSSSRNSP